ncbi:SMP-30/gluconolactonase/LRE family protein [Thermaurantiacus sp.]
MDFTVLADGLAFPEGPVWLDDGSVLVTEIAAGRLTRITRDGRKQVVADTGGGPNGAAVGPDGAIWVTNNGGFRWAHVEGMLIPGGAADDYETGRIERVDLATGRVERIYTEVDGRRLSGPNDLVFAADGSFWFTDLGKSFAQFRDHGGLYWATTDGKTVRCAQYGPHLNGVGLSPDGRTVYGALTEERNILAFDIVGPGEVAPPFLGALPGRVVASFAGRTLLDSMAILASGKIAQATLVERPGIATVHPETGATDWAEFPDLLTTNIAFGGPDMRDAAICLSTTGRLVLARWPEPGLRLAFQA